MNDERPFEDYTDLALEELHRTRWIEGGELAEDDARWRQALMEIRARERQRRPSDLTDVGQLREWAIHAVLGAIAWRSCERVILELLKVADWSIAKALADYKRQANIPSHYGRSGPGSPTLEITTGPPRGKIKVWGPARYTSSPSLAEPYEELEPDLVLTWLDVFTHVYETHRQPRLL